MKNIVPLVLAVILGLTAVFVVKHVMSDDSSRGEAMVDVVASA